MGYYAFDDKSKNYTWKYFISLQITVREHRKQKHVLKFAVVVENHGDRREPVMQDRVQQELHSGLMVELYLLRYQDCGGMRAKSWKV